MNLEFTMFAVNILANILYLFMRSFAKEALIDSVKKTTDESEQNKDYLDAYM